MKVVVSCSDVTLKVTLSEKLLKTKTVHAAVLAPFLAAFNKRVQHALDLEGIASIEIDGVAWTVDHCLKMEAASVLRGAEPRVVIIRSKIVSATPSKTAAGKLDPGSVLSSLGSMGNDPDALSSMLQSVGNDPSALSSMLQSVTHLLPPEMRAKAEKISPAQMETLVKKAAPPSKPEAAYAGVDAAGSACTHARSGPPVARPSTPTSLRAEASLRKARQRIARLEQEERSARAAASAALSATAPGATVSRMLTIDGRLVLVLDGALEEADVSAACFALGQRAAFRQAEQSVSERPEQRHGVTEHDATEFCATPLYRRIAALLPLFFPEANYTPNRIYTNAMAFGDCALMHRDAERRSGVPDPSVENVTALFYANPSWETGYAGETVFFSEAGDAVEVVLPRPGRLLLFAASIQHVGRPPSRLFWGQRYTLAIKFAAQPLAEDERQGRLAHGDDEDEEDEEDEEEEEEEDEGLVLESQPEQTQGKAANGTRKGGQSADVDRVAEELSALD
jgi:SM-20-related protein